MTILFTAVYILMVNANMFADPFGDGSNPLGVSYGAIYIATAEASQTSVYTEITSCLTETKLSGIIPAIWVPTSAIDSFKKIFIIKALIRF